MIKVNQRQQQDIKKRIMQIDQYLLTHSMLFNPKVEDMLRERSLLSLQLKRL